MADGALDRALTPHPAAVWLSFGDPATHIGSIHAASALAVCQVGRVQEAVGAAEAGADVVVVQGSEAGGHARSGRGLSSLVPAVAEALGGDVPLVAAGGLVDRRGFDAVTALGAWGVAVGTALYTTHEAIDTDAAKARLVSATGDDTVQSRVYDHVRGPLWPPEYVARTVRTQLTDQWAGRENELAPAIEAIRDQYAADVADSNMDRRALFAGEGLGVSESGEGGLMGLEIDGRGRIFVMYTGAVDNRIVRLEPDGSQTVLADGITKASIHNGGRLRLGPAGALYAATGDAAQPALAPDPASRNGKVLRIDPDRGEPSVFSRGHRNIQGLCLAPGGPLMATEHGPDRGDEINVLSPGFDGGWPGTVGNGVHNYTPTIAPAGCAVYDSELIPEWRGSMLFVTLKGRDLRRLSFGPDGSVRGEEVLFDGEFGRLRDVAVGPDGAVYLTTSNRDGRGSPAAGDDRILRVAPAP